VLDTAIALADAQGVDALSMRTLAHELGVEAMSLYHWVPAKDALLSAMVDTVVAQIEVPSSSTEWRRSLRAIALSSYAVLSKHRWACRLMLTSRDVPSRLRYMEAILGTLRRAGFSVAEADLAYHALDSHIVGFTMWQESFAFRSRDDMEKLGRAFLASLPEGTLPHLIEHTQHHLSVRRRAGTDFEFGLDLILDGLERLRAQRRSPATA
jgi:AcrR family transcriptional regulator